MQRLTLVATVIASLNLDRVRASVRRIIHTESSGGIRPTAKIQSVSNTLCLPLKCKMLLVLHFHFFFRIRQAFCHLANLGQCLLLDEIQKSILRVRNFCRSVGYINLSALLLDRISRETVQKNLWDNPARFYGLK